MLLAGAGAGRAGLEGVEETAVRWVEAGLGDLADRGGGSEEVIELDPARSLELRPRTHPQPGLGDHAEDALGADQRPVGRGPGARPRQPPALPGPPRRDRPHRLDQVVDVRVERREVPARPRRHPTPERRVLERLRKVPQRQPVLPQLILQPRPGSPRLNPRGQRLRIDLEHPIQPLQIERDHRPILQPRLHPTDHTRPTAERNDRGPLSLSPREHHLDLRLVLGKRHQIRRILEFPPKPPHHVPIGLPQCMGHPLVVVIRKEIPERARGFQPRAPQLNLLQRHRLLQLPAETKPLPDTACSLLKLLARGRLILIPPPPVLKPPLCHQRRSAGGAWCPSPGGSGPNPGSAASDPAARRPHGEGHRAPTNEHLSSGEQKQRPQWKAPYPAPPHPSPSQPATPGTACRPG